MGRDYYLGLDMGTSSVGWAVTDENYNLLRAKGKDLWGIREFEEAEGGIARRQNRISRRRRQREQVRIGLLQSYFADEIEKVDPNFYQRLENSKYHLEDKDGAVKNKNALFNDENYTDKEYYKEYPTVFHLRSELIHNTDPHDVRLVYLALLNMFKHRGHFLNASLSSEEETQTMKDAYLAFRALVDEVISNDEETNLTFPEGKAKDIEVILSSRDYNRSRKAELLLDLLGFAKKDKAAYALIKGMCGLAIDVKTVFNDIETEDKLNISFSDSNYEEKAEEVRDALGDERFELLEAVKAMYDIGSLASVLKGKQFLSDARIEDYNKHKADLKLLKQVVRKYSNQKTYNELFRGKEPGSYSAYVNSTNAGKKQRRNMGGNAKRNQEGFYTALKKILKKMPAEDADVQMIISEIEKETFLPKQLTFANGVIPNQVHSREMKAILKNAEEYLPFLKEIDESGLSTSERILQLFSFQIPYYVGPVSPKSQRDGGNGWVVRKEEGQVFPWNIEEKIDMAETSEKFIKNLVRECTYIGREKVLPKGSLLYERFCVLNEINNIKIDGRPIEVELKQQIFEEKFKPGKKVTRKQLVNYLHQKGALQEDAQLTGIDKTINNSLSSYGKFYALFGEELKKDSYQEMAEDIIYWCTIYGDSKSFLKRNLQKKYGDVLDEKQLKRILGFKFKDWGRMSKEFLELQGVNKETGEVMSLIGAMWETNLNMMELIHSENFTFAEELGKKQNNAYKTLSEFKFEDLEDYYFSAPVKRMIWQTLLIIKELEKVLGAPPKRVFIEMTRSEGEKGDRGRTVSRKKQFEDLYKSIKDETQDWASIIENADASGKLRSKKMYLYLTQMGKCMYCGKPIELDNLYDDNLYDVDHIYPRHYVKDDNLGNNLVLTHRQCNAKKTDSYPITWEIRNRQTAEWKSLRKKGLITEEKYRRLTGTNPFSEEQQADFIARQLVQTSQGTKGVADLLKQLLPDTTIAYSKASNVSDFRRDYKLYKSRLINDFHHANDAYLNIVVGNAYLVKFTQNPLNFVRSGNVEYNLGRMFDKDIVRNGEVAWLADDKKGDHGTITTVKKVMARNTPMLTRMPLEGHGAIANATLYPAQKASPDNYIPLKGSDQKLADVTKYGGYTSVSTGHFILVEHEVKGVRVRSLEALPLLVSEKLESREQLNRYCRDELGLVKPDVRLDGIKVQALMKVNGYYLHLSGKTNKQLAMRNAVNLCLNREWVEYIHLLEKGFESGNWNLKVNKKSNSALYALLADKHCNTIFSKRPNPVGEKLKSEQDTFDQLPLEKQANLLLQILHLSEIGITQADLREIGGAGIAGKMLLSKDISKYDEAILINQSVTGLFEREIDLKTV
ncbi:MAG: type II CRISPR RNA-guided endonuclease Cas9 [Clostridia bacterium]|nr:type II CRISPR RNA-guided endonuclease Cas9 [Clostridia bacterium]